MHATMTNDRAVYKTCKFLHVCLACHIEDGDGASFKITHPVATLRDRRACEQNRVAQSVYFLLNSAETTYLEELGKMRKGECRISC